MSNPTTDLQCGLCGEEALRLTHARTGQTAYVCSSPDCPGYTDWFDEEETVSDNQTTAIKAVVLDPEDGEAGIVEIMSGRVLARFGTLRGARSHLENMRPHYEAMAKENNRDV